jgi:hypothetical protein
MQRFGFEHADWNSYWPKTTKENTEFPLLE